MRAVTEVSGKRGENAAQLKQTFESHWGAKLFLLMFDGCIVESRRQVVLRSPAEFTSACDLQSNLRTNNARCLDYAFAGTPAPIETHKPHTSREA